MYKRAPLEKRLRQRGPGQVITFWGYDYSGKRYEASTHQTDKKAALDAARRIERERSVPPTDSAAQEAQTFTLGQAMKLLAAHDKRVQAKPNTVRFHQDRGRHLIRVFGAGMLCAAIDKPELIRYSDKRLGEEDYPADRHTIQKEHRVLRLALRLAKEMKCYVGDPGELTVEGFTEANGQAGYYQPGEIWLERVEWVDALVAATSSNPDKHRIDRRDDMLLYVNCGLRRREPHLILPQHVDLQKRTLTIRMPVRERKQKNEGRKTGLKTDRSKRVLPLNDLLVELLRRRLRHSCPGEPLFKEWGSGNRDLKANWRRARTWLLERAEKTDGKRGRAELDAILPRSLTFNDLRRTFCSLMKNAGVSLDDCAALLGHEDRAMVELVYGHTAMDTLHRAVAKLPEMHLPPEELPRVKGPSRRQRQRKRAGALASNKTDVSEVADSPTESRLVSSGRLPTVSPTNPPRERVQSDVG